jgi:hypothetical protein
VARLASLVVVRCALSACSVVDGLRRCFTEVAGGVFIEVSVRVLTCRVGIFM